MKDRREPPPPPPPAALMRRAASSLSQSARDRFDPGESELPSRFTPAALSAVLASAARVATALPLMGRSTESEERRLLPPLLTVDSRRVLADSHGLTLVHVSAQLEPCLTQKNTSHTLNTPWARATQALRAPPTPYKALKLS